MSVEKGKKIDWQSEFGRTLQYISYFMYTVPASILAWSNLYGKMDQHTGRMLLISAIAICVTMLIGCLLRILSSVAPENREKVLLAVNMAILAGIIGYSINVVNHGLPESVVSVPKQSNIESKDIPHADKVEILITKIPGIGPGGNNDMGDIEGSVSGVENPESLRVVVYAITDRWYIQPRSDSPLTEIGRNGSWKRRIYLGQSYAALLVRPDYVPAPIIECNNAPQCGDEVIAMAQVGTQ